jgi:exosortase A-associated hydrolase 1
MSSADKGHDQHFRRGRYVSYSEQAISYQCDGSSLYGILSLPEQAAARGVLIVVGGPQYRAGSHRQFTLLARYFAENGMPVLRFDYRGMGDSAGDVRDFEDVQEDIRHSMDAFLNSVPGLEEVVIWGLCDAASAALFYAHRDPRVRGLVLLNPWVRTDQGIAKAYLKHYYLNRIVSREFWNKVLCGRFNYVSAAKSALNLVRDATSKTIAPSPANKAIDKNTGNLPPLPERMLDCLDRFNGNVLFILSGNDMTAQEFLDVVKGSRKWQKHMRSSRVQRRDLVEANHTFSQRNWRAQVGSWTREWMGSW